MRSVKVLAALAGGILILLTAGLFAVWLLVNPNDYKLHDVLKKNGLQGLFGK